MPIATISLSHSTLATAASVRTLALVEVLFAQAISRFIFSQPTTGREAAGIVLIVIGALILIAVLVFRPEGLLGERTPEGA